MEIPTGMVHRLTAFEIFGFRILGFGILGFGILGFSVLGFRVLEFQGSGFRDMILDCDGVPGSSSSSKSRKKSLERFPMY